MLHRHNYLLISSCSAILTILQIQSAENDPLTRYSALLSLICALMSLLYGGVYIIRFGAMRKTHKAAEWAAVSDVCIPDLIVLPNCSIGSAKDRYRYLVECLGYVGNASYMACMVSISAYSNVKNSKVDS